MIMRKTMAKQWQKGNRHSLQIREKERQKRHKCTKGHRERKGRQRQKEKF